jgi:hypothetical protein
MSQQTRTLDFPATLERFEGVGTWTFLTVPFQVEEVFGKKGQVKVRGTINGVAYRGSLMPHGNGHHFLVVKKSIRDQARVSVGEIVHVSMSLDIEERRIILPIDFQDALEQSPAAHRVFEGLSYSKKKGYVDWIEQAKGGATRSKRVTKTIEQLEQQPME